ncbi:MAG: hypothetical protein ACOZQL_10225 [Myxococcota bacterium]
MKRVSVLMVGLVAMSGCTFGARTCVDPGDCAPSTDQCVDGFCVERDGGPGGGGGSTGGGGGSTGGGGGGSTDAGACASNPCNDAEQFCVNTASGHECRLRWSGIQILSPDAGSMFNATTAGSIPVVARLTSASGNDGGGIAPGSMMAGTATLTRMQGQYSGTVSLSGTGMRSIGVSATFATGALDASVVVNVDTEAPTITLNTEPAPTRATGTLTETDPQAGYEQAFKKDEVVEVRVEATEPVMVGPADFGTLSGAMTTKSSCTTCPSGRVCTCFNLDLAKVAFPMARGDLQISVGQLRDAAGNTGSAPAPKVIKVTRWKWSRNLASASTNMSSPALDASGNVFVGLGLGVVGSVSAVRPSGAVLSGFGSSVTSAVTAGPIVRGGSVFVATRDATIGQIEKLDAISGSRQGMECISTNYTFKSTLSVSDIGQNPEAVFAVSSNGTLVAARVGASSGIGCAPKTVPATTQQYSVVTNGGSAFLASSSAGALIRIPWTSTNQQWEMSTSNSTSLFTQGLVAFGTTIGGGGGGVNTAGVYAAKSDGSLSQRADFIENGASVSPAGPPVVGGTVGAPVFYYGNSAPSVVRVDYAAGDPGSFDAGVSTTSAPSQAVVSAPVVGDSEIYVVDSQGGVYAYSHSLSLRWSMGNGISNSVVSHPNLDVARSAGQKQCGRGGVLYVTSSGSGNLYAFVVDSNGLKSDAPWPKWQHDPSNSGNPAVPLSDWTCP